MVFTLMAVGAAGVVVVWRLVAAGRVTIWAGQAFLFAAAGSAALATGRVHLSPRVWWTWALLVGSGTALVLYVATLAFVAVVRRWPPFERHVDQIYDQRRGLSLPAALVLAAAVVAPGEELFWRGLFQGRLAGATGWVAAALVTWAVYVVANAASGSLPILAAAVVSGAVWGALALWTHGVLASLACHSLWTALMVAAPPATPPEADEP
jgi:membrane protease YdiL (CAAX protease family)